MSSAESRGVLDLESVFKYPESFSAAQYHPLTTMSMFFPERIQDAPLSPKVALIHWENHVFGSWQSTQAARYPTLHRDLPQAVIGLDEPSEIDAFQLRQLSLMAQPPTGKSDALRYGHTGFDFHPIGHMARVSVELDRLLIGLRGDTARKSTSFEQHVMRHTAALHDIGETEHPALIVHLGAVLGDIGADKGKSDDDRMLERIILKTSLDKVFPQYSPDFREAVEYMASHDIDGQTEEFVACHALLEIAHELNRTETALHLGNMAVKIAQMHPKHAFIMAALAGDSYRRMTKDDKHKKLFSHLGKDIKGQVTTIMSGKLSELRGAARNLNRNDAYITWRKQDAVVACFGPTELR